MESYYKVALSANKRSNALRRCEHRRQVLLVFIVDSEGPRSNPVICQRPSQMWGTSVLTRKELCNMVAHTRTLESETEDCW